MTHYFESYDGQWCNLLFLFPIQTSALLMAWPMMWTSCSASDTMRVTWWTAPALARGEAAGSAMPLVSRFVVTSPPRILNMCCLAAWLLAFLQHFSALLSLNAQPSWRLLFLAPVGWFENTVSSNLLAQWSRMGGSQPFVFFSVYSYLSWEEHGKYAVALAKKRHFILLVTPLYL